MEHLRAAFDEKRELGRVYDGQILDITGPQHVTVEIDRKRRVVYVHVNGITAFRACRIETLEVNEEPK